MTSQNGEQSQIRHESAEHCEDAHFCLTGTNCFQNNMFVTTLRQMCQCLKTFHAISLISDVPASLLSQPDHKVVFYLNCFELNRSALETLMHKVYWTIQPKQLYALFNLNKNTKIEKTALKYGARGLFYQSDAPDDFCKGTRKILCGEL